MSFSEAEARIRRLASRLTQAEYRVDVVRDQIMRTRQNIAGFYQVGANFGQQTIDCDYRVLTNGCSGKAVSGTLVELFHPGDLVTVVASETSAFGMIGAITPSAFGSGYTSVPTVALSGGTGTGEVLLAIMRVHTVTRTAGGSGYTNGSYTNGTFVGGGGTGGTFSYSVTGGVINTTITVLTPGTGYTSAPTPVFNAGPGTGATATATLRLLSVQVLDGGTGHTLPAPTVGFSGGGGSGAVAAATVSAYAEFVDLPEGSYEVKLTPPLGYDLEAGFATTGITVDCGNPYVGFAAKTMAPTAGNSCICTCANPWPTVFYIEDDNGIHTLSPLGLSGLAWRVSYVAPGTIVNAAFPCTEAGTGVNVRYDLTTVCDDGAPDPVWRLTITFGTWCCIGTGGDPDTLRYSNASSGSLAVEIPYDSDDCMQETLEFTMPTTVSGSGSCAAMTLPMPGGGGTLVVSR